MLVDILSQVDTDAATFTVNIAADWVAPTIPVGDWLLTKPDGKGKFEALDNFTLISAMVVLPLGFEFYESPGGAPGWIPYLNLGVIANAVDYQLPEFTLYMPWANYEMNVNRFYNIKETVLNAQPYQLKFTLVNARISMFGVDASLDGKTFRIPISAKVGHTLPLTI